MRIFWVLMADYGFAVIGWWARGLKEQKEKGELMRFYTDLLSAHTKDAK